MITGAQVRAARALLGWSVRDLAQRAVVSIATVNLIESAKRPRFAEHDAPAARGRSGDP